MEQNNCEENVKLWNSTLYVFSIHYLSENRVKTEPLTYIATCKRIHLETTSDPTQHGQAIKAKAETVKRTKQLK